MAPITHVGYLRRREESGIYEQKFAVLWNGELSLFTCSDSSQTFPDLNTDGEPPAVVCLAGAVAVMPFRPSPSAPGAFTLLGPRSTWKAHFLASSKEEALIWLARFNECRPEDSGMTRDRRCVSAVIPTDIGESVDESPNIIPSTALANWIRRARETQSNAQAHSPSYSINMNKRIAMEKLACLNQQLQEREYLLKQMEDEENQFVNCQQQDFKPCRFVSAAKTSFCLLGGKKTTEVQSGDKVVVLGLQPDFTWRCRVERLVHAVVGCRDDGQPGCRVVVGESPDIPHRRNSVGNMAKPSSRRTSIAGKAEAVSAAEVSQNYSTDSHGDGFLEPEFLMPGLKETPGERRYIRRASAPAMAVPSPVRAPRALAPQSPTTPVQPSEQFTLNVSAKEVLYTLAGTLPSLRVLSFVPEEAYQVQAETHLRKRADSQRSLTSSLKQQKPLIRTMTNPLVRLRSSGSIRSSKGSAASMSTGQSPRKKQNWHQATTFSSLQNLPMAPISMSVTSNDGQLMEEQSFCIGSQSAEPRLGYSSLSAPGSPSSTISIGYSEESSDDEDTISLTSTRRASFRRLFNRRSAPKPATHLRSTLSDGTVTSSGSPKVGDTGLHSESSSALPVAELPSQSSLGQLRGSCSCAALGKSPGEVSLLSLASASSLPSEHELESRVSLQGWDYESSSSSIEAFCEGKSKLVQFDWPSPGLHLSSFMLVLANTDGRATLGSTELELPEHPAKEWRQRTMVTVTHVDDLCSAYGTALAVGDIVLSINEHALDGCDAETAWDILRSISKTSVRLRLMPLAGLARLELGMKRLRLEARLFQKAFSYWLLDQLTSAVVCYIAVQKNIHIRCDSSDEETCT